MAIYDFMADFNQLRENYKSYDEKGKKSLEDLQKSIDEQKAVEEAKIQKDKEKELNNKSAPKKDIFGSILGALGGGGKSPGGGGGGLMDLFKGKDSSKTPNMDPVTSNADGTINLTQDQIDNPYNGYSEGPGSGPNTLTEGANAESGASSNFLGTQGEGEAMATIGFGMDAYKNLSTEASSDEEAMMNTASLTMKGAQAGMSIGGPWGAAIGGVAGLTMGVVDLFGDRGKRNQRIRDNYHDMLNKGKTQREQEQRMKDGEESLKALTELRKHQLNYITTKY